jgi:transposase
VAWPRVTVYVYGVPTDMRKGFDGLSALVGQRLGPNPLNGDVYLFLSRDRVRAKVLHFDGTGLCIYTKRLERGRFASLWREERMDPMTLTVSELDLFLDGSGMVGRVALTPPPVPRQYCVRPRIH